MYFKFWLVCNKGSHTIIGLCIAEMINKFFYDGNSLHGRGFLCAQCSNFMMVFARFFINKLSILFCLINR
jgi:hypothetical protein